MRWLELTFALCAAALAVACTDSDTTETTAGGGGPAGGIGGVANGGSGAIGAQGGGGSGATGGAGGSGGECQNVLPNEMTPPATLSATGLYSDIATQTLASYVQEFTPKYPLWTDTAVKRRWIYLPECNPVIDNSNEDVWDFPVGTRAWKEFARDGTLVETRMIHRWGPGDDDFIFAAYLWNGDDDEADHLVSGDGLLDAKGTEHDIPTDAQCTRCHGGGLAPGGTPARLAGFSAIQLSHANAGATMTSLSNDGHLLIPYPAGYTVPGTQVESDALGYLHANCSNCHNDTADGVLFPAIRMRVLAADAAVTDTKSYNTLVDENYITFTNGSCTKIIDGQDEANSCLLVRMQARGPDDNPGGSQMPPLGTQDADTAGGVAAIQAWIAALP